MSGFATADYNANRVPFLSLSNTMIGELHHELSSWNETYFFLLSSSRDYCLVLNVLRHPRNIYETRNRQSIWWIEAGLILSN